MGKDRGRNDARSRIAHFAARLMAEDGIEDYATAKRKAARQAGLADVRQLPTNEEIDAALRTYQVLYGGAAQREHLRRLRVQALAVMREFARFNPYLTGSVLSGNAGKFADINVHLYAESVKAVELDLLNRNVGYRAGQCRLYLGDELRTVPLFTLERDGTSVELVVLTLDDLRAPVKTNPGGRAVERAKTETVAALLETRD
jgi:hypothetical protein